MGSKRAYLLVLAALSGGCVQRMMTLNSTPPGALVTLNGQEAGRTPLTRDFTWYGNYDVEVRAEGYQTLKTQTNVRPPWWQWIPIDLLAEVLPVQLTDHQSFEYRLQPVSTRPVNAQAIAARGQRLADELPATQPHVPPATQPTTAP